MDAKIINVVLIDDDEDDYLITAEFLQDKIYGTYHLTWISNYQDGLDAILIQGFDVFLIDLHLGAENGLELIRRGLECGCTKPLILLTGMGDRTAEMRALEFGASDYLVKGQFNSQVLERAIMYAIRHSQTLDQLRLSESRYRAVLDSQDELICRFDPNTTLTFVNGAYAHFFNMTQSELVGMRWIELVDEYQRTDVLQRITQVSQTKRAITLEQRYIRSGQIRWYQWTEQPVLDNFGHIVELQATGFDITDRKEAEITLRSALERERELNELKSRFVTMASHEFRTPLTTIIGTASYLEMAEGKISAEKRVSRLSKIVTAANDMTHLLEDVLLFGKAEAGRLEFDPTPVDISTLTKEIVEDLRATVGKNHLINLVDKISLSTKIVDKKLIQQIFTNLLTNAIKYSPLGSHILFELGETDDAFYFIIQDHGIGISDDDQRHLFIPFYRANNVRDISGTGLGLTISKIAVELHNGTIDLESKLNQGTRIKVTLPNTQRVTGLA